MGPCLRCGRAEMADVTHACTPQVTILGPSLSPPGPPIDIPSIMRAGGFSDGTELERRRIVAWLRTFEVIRGGSLTAEEDAAHETLLMVVADAIERGDHVSSETKR